MFSAHELTRRDYATAALLGLQGDADFGFESESHGFEAASGFAPASQFADSAFTGGFASESDVGWEAVGAEGFFGADGGFFSGEFGNDTGAEFGATAIPKPTEAQALALWHRKGRQAMRQHRRSHLLYPNEGLEHKVERYQLNISQTFTIGTATVLNALTKQPDTALRAQRVMANVVVPVLVFYSEIKVANVSITQGDAGDAFFLTPQGWGTQFDIPTLSPANRVTVLANSTTFVPPGFIPGNSYPVVFSFIGPASEVA